MTTRRSGAFIALFSFLCCSLMFSAGNCQNLDELMQSYGNAISKSMNDSGDSSSSDALRSGIALLAHPGKAKCLQKLSPCKEFLHFEGTPPSSCCDPLTDIVTNSTEDCVCILNNDDLLHTVNITRKDALALAGACGAKPDLSNCKNDTADAPSGSSGTATISLPPISLDSSGAGSDNDTADDSSASSSSSDDKKESSAAAAPFGGKNSRLGGLFLAVTTLLGLNLV